MEISENTGREKHKTRVQSADSQLTRRCFLKRCGAAVGGGAFLSSIPALGSETAESRLKRLVYQYNPEELYWRGVMNEFALKEELIHMNTGTLSTPPLYVLEKLNQYNQEVAEDPYPTIYVEPYKLDEVHTKVCAFMGAALPKDEIVITNCTTEGMSFVAMGLDLEPGDEVITTMHEHPGGLDCWRVLKDRRGITLTELPFQCAFDSKQDIVDLFANAITSNTKVMSFCHINYTTGLMLPVKELCTLARDRDIISVVDGAHAIGMLKDLNMVDLGCDFYACSPQKWLCCPPGVGVFYAKKDKQHLIWPTITEGYDLNKWRRRLEFRGQQSLPVWVCIKDAIDFQNTIGREKIEDRIMSLSRYAKNRLLEIPGVGLHCSLDPEQSTGLVSFYIKDELASHSDINDKIKNDYNIIMRTVYHYDYPGSTTKIRGMRISTHIYNNYDQIDLLCQAIEKNLDMM